MVERRNLYRILFVQPEAPAEVIKASWRALMSTARAHPDLGGAHDQAAKLNAAYHVLGDAERRRAYDDTLRAARAAAGSAMPHDPWCWLSDRRCPFCGHGFVASPTADSQCMACTSPITPAPNSPGTAGEILGRRRSERFAREVDASLHLPGVAGHRSARLRDLSLSGLAMDSPVPLAKGSTFRVETPGFSSVAAVVACDSKAGKHTVHAQLLTLQLRRSGGGVFVSTRA
ncbi:MAG: DnaJ domain-containing protein [Burkholderiales bacterium]|nr:DnaJ domain-containing protein [Burkholderiales bacterium]